jgi:hypothetical protein
VPYIFSREQRDAPFLLRKIRERRSMKMAGRIQGITVEIGGDSPLMTVKL